MKYAICVVSCHRDISLTNCSKINWPKQTLCRFIADHEIDLAFECEKEAILVPCKQFYIAEFFFTMTVYCNCLLNIYLKGIGRIELSELDLGSKDQVLVYGLAMFKIQQDDVVCRPSSMKWAPDREETMNILSLYVDTTWCANYHRRQIWASGKIVS